ncbi:MAG: hypothetical protein AAFU64_09760, partial [Bacteroidota bacterium]
MNSIYKFTIYTAFILGPFFLAYGQTGPDDGGGSSIDDFSKGYLPVTPPSPQAASLGKYVETPVDLSTGQPSISIPLCALEGKEINVPVSLSYRSGGGIKVEDISSWVGLGFDLNAGGVITRTVYGNPDETGPEPNQPNFSYFTLYDDMQRFSET